MSQYLSDFVIQVKREGRYGDTSVTSDSATSDIIRAVNDICFAVWRKWDWPWSVEKESFTQSGGSADKTLSSDVGDILAIDAGGDNYLRKITVKEFLRWQKRASETEGSIKRYIKRGRDSSGNFRLTFHPTPASDASVVAWYKKRLTRYTVADIATNTGMLFFPDEVLDVVRTGVLSRVAKIQGDKEEMLLLLNQFNKDLAALVAEEESEPDEEIQAPPPDFYRRRRRARTGTAVV